ncbi:unnamed protein product [Owenia fusiformis]|uniref:ABC1 atypical kinase-like domain-containing protein n=1 Tax=Owenia fusiformis TaxID=6347 RepID=A0A8S4PH38_OWEFU|nr:unnamed protein product [Owenia fusiformis]
MQDNMMASSQSVKDDVKPDLAENESTLRYETTTKDDSNHIREEMSTDDEQLHTKNDTSMKGSINDQAGRDDAKPIPTPIKPNRNKPIGAKLSQSLSDRARERRVPSSRLGRLMSYGSLAAGLGVGAMAEVARRGMGLSDSSDKIGVLDKNPLLSDANAERIVNTLCRVRGAALKLGQMLSIQDSSMINPDVQRIFERVRQSADFMPKAQLDKAMRTELGNDWRNKFESFDDKPFAAASIGQVHRGTTLDGREVAVKIQYPGVADSINSDINNLMAVLNIWQILPKGLYVEEFIETAKEELSWECDYEREAASSQKFRALVKDDPVFYVPEVISELSSKRVMTSELVSGAPLDSAMSLDQDTKNFIAENLLRLCLQELFVFNYMQTDPNWSNFLYDNATKRICLLDFGSAREYSKENFVDGYLRIIKGAADGKKEEVLEWSKKLGFLTGYESKAMQNAHVDAVMILGEAFSEDIFDFSTQTTTQRIQTIIPVMLKHRLTPPPEETYSLHRKLSGSYLLCTKFSAKIQCKKSLDEIWKNYHFLNLEAAPTSS